MGAQSSSLAGSETPPHLTNSGGERQSSRSSPHKRRRAASEDEWDFFLPLDEQQGAPPSASPGVSAVSGPLSWTSPEAHPPVYILEASLSEQELWHATAGKRPPQPPDERKYYEDLYRSNFERSEALKDKNIFDDSAIEKASRMRRESSEEVLFRGKGPFSYAVSKSFLHCAPAAMTLQVSNMASDAKLTCVLYLNCLNRRVHSITLYMQF